MSLSKSRANIIIKYLDQLASKFSPLIIIETGTIRNTKSEYVLGDGHSTRIIAEWLKQNPNNKNFASVDKAVGVARKYLTELNLIEFVELYEMDSVDFLKEFELPIHLAYLDSANDANLTLAEFKAVDRVLPKGGIVIVDDCVPGSSELLKGNKVIPYAKAKGYRVKLTSRQGVIFK